MKRQAWFLQKALGQVVTFSQQNPVLMIFEDAHWTDPTSLERFDRTVSRIPSLRALLIQSSKRRGWTAPCDRPHPQSAGRA
jgi:predicted ATPase